MSRKIPDFFTKKSIKIESSEVKPNVVSINIDDEISVKLESENNCSNLSEISAEHPQNLTSKNISRQENQRNSKN